MVTVFKMLRNRNLLKTRFMSNKFKLCSFVYKGDLLWSHCTQLFYRVEPKCMTRLKYCWWNLLIDGMFGWVRRAMNCGWKGFCRLESLSFIKQHRNHQAQGFCSYSSSAGELVSAQSLKNLQIPLNVACWREGLIRKESSWVVLIYILKWRVA